MNICIVGTGYVGLVAAACLAEMGNDVVCIDVNPEIIDQLKAGNVHIFEPGLEPLVTRNTAEGRLTFSSDLAEGMQDALFVFSCVGTPSMPDGSCDLSYVDLVAAQIGRIIDDYKIIVNKSTVPVGTADRVKGIISKELQARGVSVEFDVVSNPEFLKEGDAVNDFLKPDRVIVGTDNVRTAKLLETLYAPFARSRDKMIVMGVRSAEMTKYAANCMLATKISFMNEVANICETVGADVREVRAGHRLRPTHRLSFHLSRRGIRRFMLPQRCSGTDQHGQGIWLHPQPRGSGGCGQQPPERHAGRKDQTILQGKRGGARKDSGPVGPGVQGQYR